MQEFVRAAYDNELSEVKRGIQLHIDVNAFRKVLLSLSLSLSLSLFSQMRMSFLLILVSLGWQDSPDPCVSEHG